MGQSSAIHAVAELSRAEERVAERHVLFQLGFARSQILTILVDRRCLRRLARVMSSSPPEC
jgi:hypothetical protein